MKKKIYKKFWNITSVSTDESEITMYGDVCSSQPIDWWTGELIPGLFITPEGFLEDLEKVKDKPKITIKLNSCGGDLYTGIAIHNALKGIKSKKTVIVEGIAASAASVIMCAGDDVQVYPGSMVMIHGVAGLFFDYMTTADLKLAIKGFDAAEKAIAEIYNAKTGTETDTLRSMMTKETWMIGKEAVEKGFADSLLTDDNVKMSISNDRKMLLVAGIRHDVSGFRNVPKNIPTNKKLITQGGKQMFRKRKKNGLEEDVMDIDETVTDLEESVDDLEENVDDIEETVGELEQEVEDLKDEIEELKEEIAELKGENDDSSEGDASTAATSSAIKAAVKKERARIKAIDDIAANINNPALVYNAKYGDKPCTAQTLAFYAMKKQSKLGAVHLENVKTDYFKSGAGTVKAKPGGSEADDAAEIKAAADRRNKNRGGKK